MRTRRLIQSCALCLLGLGAIVFTGCATTSGTTAEGSLTSAPKVERHHAGERLYKRKCGRCHGLYDIPSYSDESWTLIMQDMAGEANLDADEERLVTAYVLAHN